MAFGTYGSGDGEFNEPSAVTQLMPSGKLLVSDRRNKRLQVPLRLIAVVHALIMTFVMLCVYVSMSL